MTDLIERLEQAKGPDRELDALIHFAVTPQLKTSMCTKEGWIVGGSRPQPTKAPEYTRSIDAALTLARHQFDFYRMLFLAAQAANETRTGNPYPWPAIKAALLYALKARAQSKENGE